MGGGSETRVLQAFLKRQRRRIRRGARRHTQAMACRPPAQAALRLLLAIAAAGVAANDPFAGDANWKLAWRAVEPGRMRGVISPQAAGAPPATTRLRPLAAGALRPPTRRDVLQDAPATMLARHQFSAPPSPHDARVRAYTPPRLPWHPPCEQAGACSLAFNESGGFFTDVSDLTWKHLKRRFRETEDHDEKNGAPDWPRKWYQNNWEPKFTCQFERRIGGMGARHFFLFFWWPVFAPWYAHVANVVVPRARTARSGFATRTG